MHLGAYYVVAGNKLSINCMLMLSLWFSKGMLMHMMRLGFRPNTHITHMHDYSILECTCG